MTINKLTQKLLAEGYTKENYPDYVSEWNDFYGGFEYKYNYRNTLLFSTPCGLHIKGSSWACGNMSYQGIVWSMENDNPTINCPYHKNNCELNHPLLRDAKIPFICCACHQIDGLYDYNKSLDRVNDLEEKRQERLFAEFATKKDGRVCKLHCRFNASKDCWEQNYDPIDVCARYDCSYCSVLKKNFSGKKGNVFYDIITKRIIAEGEGFCREEKIQTSIIKGKKLLSKPAPIEICEIIAKTKQNQILNRVRNRYSSQLFFAEYHGVYFEVDVINIRAERKETRDLMQDLTDISNGITVVHDSDNIKAVKQKKSEARQARLESQKKKYLKMIANADAEEIDPVYQRRIDKFIKKGIISQDEIDEAKEAHKDNFEQTKLF